jgi:hypothetical protein
VSRGQYTVGSPTGIDRRLAFLGQNVGDYRLGEQIHDRLTDRLPRRRALRPHVRPSIDRSTTVHSLVSFLVIGCAGLPSRYFPNTACRLVKAGRHLSSSLRLPRRAGERGREVANHLRSNAAHDVGSKLTMTGRTDCTMRRPRFTTI